MVPHSRTIKAAWFLFSALGVGALAGPVSAGSYKVIYSFTGGADGVRPVGAVIQDKLGNLYGETEYGGSRCPVGPGRYIGDYGCGTVYKVDAKAF